MRMLIELTTVRVQGAEDADLHALFTGPSQHGAGGGPEEGIEQWPVVTEKGSEQMGYGKHDVLPVAVGENMRLLSNPQLCSFKSATATGL